MNPLARYARQFRAYAVVILVHEWRSPGGAWRSMHTFYEALLAQGKPVRLVHRKQPGSLKVLLGAARYSPKLVVNGMSAFLHWETLLLCWLRKDCYLYLHDTEYMLAEMERTYPCKYRWLRFLLGRNPVLCVSEAMAKLYQERFGATTHVVYETLPPLAEADFNPAKTNIVMVGTQNARKGVELFSKVADLAKANGHSWAFHWIGGQRHPGLYYSENVNWLGWVDGPQHLLRQAAAMLLTSVDDPFPLSALEAIRAGTRCVVYEKTGTSEVVSGIQGCQVFHDHTPESALAALEAALSENVDTEAYAKLADTVYGEQVFTERMLGILSS